MKKNFLSILLIGALILFLGATTSVTNAIADQSGAETYTRTFDAPSFRTNYDSTVDGGQGSVLAHSTITDDRGSAEAYATLGLDPILKVKAEHLGIPLKGAIATAWAIQGYTYTGSTTESFTLNPELTGSVNNPAESSGIGLFAEICIYGVDSFEHYTDRGSLGEIGAELIHDTAETFLSITETTTDGSKSGSIVFDLDPGQSFYLWAELNAIAINSSSSADAYNTLNLTFDDTTNLELGATVVPIPGAIWLLGSGLVGLIGFARRRSN